MHEIPARGVALPAPPSPSQPRLRPEGRLDGCLEGHPDGHSAVRSNQHMSSLLYRITLLLALGSSKAWRAASVSRQSRLGGKGRSSRGQAAGPRRPRPLTEPRASSFLSRSLAGECPTQAASCTSGCESAREAAGRHATQGPAQDGLPCTQRLPSDRYAWNPRGALQTQCSSALARLACGHRPGRGGGQWGEKGVICNTLHNKDKLKEYIRKNCRNKNIGNDEAKKCKQMSSR